MNKKYLQSLSGENTLEVYLDEALVFSSRGHWLHPLFELEDFLKENPFDAGRLTLHDSVQGRAAASLTLHLGIKKVKSNTLSALALSVYDKAGAEVSYDNLVPRITCRTEDLIKDGMTEEEIYLMLRERSGR